MKRQNSFEEFIFCLGVKAAAVDYSGADSSQYRLMIKSAILGAMLNGYNQPVVDMQLCEDAIQYGRDMIRTGEDWRRQLNLLESYLRS